MLVKMLGIRRALAPLGATLHACHSNKPVIEISLLRSLGVTLRVRARHLSSRPAAFISGGVDPWSTVSANDQAFAELKPRANPAGNARVMIFDGDCDATMHQMTRAEVLRLTQEAAITTDTAGVTTDKKRPSPRAAPTRGEAVIEVQRVHARDIRQLDSAFAVRSEPSVEVRDQAILVNADPVRAIIMRHRCLVFLHEGDATLRPLLQEAFTEVASHDDADVAYEFRALEALLGALCRHYHTEFNQVAPAIKTSLGRLVSDQPSAGELNTLRSFKNTMNEFQSRVDGVRRALMATLNNEEDLHLLYLTRLHADRSLLGDLWSFDSEEAEVLIENYLQDVHALQTNAMLLQQRITNTETVVKLRLDAMRNYLLGVNIMFSVAGISLSIGTFTVGVFGMNLLTGVEQASGWFVGVTAFATTLMGVTGFATMRLFKRRGIFGSIKSIGNLTAKADDKAKLTDKSSR